MKKLILVLAAAAIATGAYAEGYQVNNMSAKQTGMGHVGTAMKLNSESIFFNPAASAFQSSRFDISAGFTGILSNVRYQSLPTLGNDYTSGPSEKSDNKLSTPIHVYFNYKPTERLAVGLGFYTPYGSSMNWGNNWSGAHLVQEINLTAFTFQPTVSYKICDRLSIGAGLMVSWGNFDLSRSLLSPTTRRGLIAGMIDPKITQLEGAINSGALTGEALAQATATLQTLEGAKGYLNNTMSQSLVSAKLEGDADVAVGVNAGFLWDITDEWSLAMTYRSRLNMKVGKGHATMNIDPTAAALIAQLGQLSPGTELIPGLDKGTFNAELPLPTTVTWGVSFRPAVKWELAVDLQWTGWSAYKALNVVFNEEELGIKPIYSVKNYSNTLAFRFGAQYRATDFITARMGMYVDESPVSSDYLNPETPSMTKVAYTAGVSLRPTKFMSIDLAYCYVSSADPERSGSYPVYGYTSGKLEEVFSGNYKLHANVFSLGVGFSF
ncbi:outer membrane protein transport protein [Alistipes sp. kh20]|uniref:OmpP1/FadL family transporter n=1 Tax=Alistipes TaxID=239759 RepID=UPI00189B3CCD|nr:MULTISPECIES: outer membrane protein transport protein [Alistipes]MBS4766830.1 outer membrane protein transport protein [Alistipes montrealensis]